MDEEIPRTNKERHHQNLAKKSWVTLIGKQQWKKWMNLRVLVKSNSWTCESLRLEILRQ